MRFREFEVAILAVPKFFAVFRLKIVPDWIRADDLRVGNLLYWNESRNSMVKIVDGRLFSITAIHLDFVSYQDANTMAFNAKGDK